MSSSLKNTKIDLMDDSKTVQKRINKADCVEGDSENGLMDLTKYLIFGIENKFIISRPEKYGGDLEYNDYESLEKDFIEKKLHPMDLKLGVTNAINKILVNFRDNEEIVNLYNLAYPKK